MIAIVQIDASIFSMSRLVPDQEMDNELEK